MDVKEARGPTHSSRCKLRVKLTGNYRTWQKFDNVKPSKARLITSHTPPLLPYAMLNTEPILYLATSVFALVSLSWARKQWQNRKHLPLPPGDIIYARLLTKPVLVINSEEIARDLFELRSTIYSDKPQSIVYEPFASDFNTALLPYGDRWRLHRRILHQPFRQANIPTYHAGLLRTTHQMLFSFLQDPTNYASHIQMFPAFVMSIVYDYQPKAKDDYLLHIMRRYLDLIVVAVGPSTLMILEAFPFLLQLPTWFPGVTYKRASVECLQAGHDVKEIPFQYVKERMSNREMPACVVADTMNSMNGFENEVIEAAIKEAACIAFAGAHETTVGTILVFLLAMNFHPEVQAKAQADIDRVIGKDRLPDFNDRPALPYVDAILRETLRWNPVFPMGIPHATTTSDIYKGYFIPKGVTVIANTWAMTHNEEKYPNPDEFKPERFIREDGSLTSDTVPSVFGWGRRACVGRHLGDAAVWIAITSFLATFSVHKALDEHGEEVPVVPKFSSGIAIHPETFPCRIIPRFQDASVERLMQLTGLDSL
ncbi:cytochrome P450 [Rhizopogon vinicolor AM-OR11-026]|uniref:Cytochrome P450 n=1 Tax=Rhizopogon vinicolor AM-OR11-026 TaxID=1314800 RepID=A0A1B7MT05_9AGAM|nr:cytochrome P450 [Rhizopogon vinicolor AM-OR11-026]